MTTTQTIKALTIILGVGKSISTYLYNFGIRHIDDLKGKDQFRQTLQLEHESIKTTKIYPYNNQEF